jgi:hypothetical protein
MLVRSNTNTVILTELIAAERDERTAKDHLTSAFMHRIQAGRRLLEKKETIKHDGQWREYIRSLAEQLAAHGYVSPATHKPYSLRYFQEWMFLAKHLPNEQKAQLVAHLGMKENLARIRDAIARKACARRVENGGTAKPEEVRKRIERLYRGAYLELYARRVAPGWTTWGNELPFGREPCRQTKRRIAFLQH